MSVESSYAQTPEFRQERFSHCVQNVIQTKKEEQGYHAAIANQPDQASVQVEDDFAYLDKLGSIGLSCTIADFRDFGEPNEIVEARQILGVVDSFTHPKPAPAEHTVFDGESGNND